MSSRRVAAYFRVSTSAQVEKWGLPAQRTALEAECARRGWEIIERFEDAGISGETLDARPAMSRMLSAAREGRFDVLLAVEWERFSRSQHGRDWGEILGAAEEGGAVLAVPGQELNPAQPDDGFLAGLFGLLSAREKRKMVARTSRGIRERVKAGKWWGSLRPYGYHVGDDGVLVVDADEAAVVRRVFAMYRAGEPLLRIAIALNVDGLRPHKGGQEWRSNTVRRLLSNPVYAGRLHYGRTTKRARGGEPIVVEHAHEPIVAPHEFDAVQTLRDARKRAGVPMSRWDSGFVLTGLIECPTCGHRMYGCSSGKPSPKCPNPIRYYGHRMYGPVRCRKVRAAPIEQAVIEQVAQALARLHVDEDVRRELVAERLRDGTDESKRRAEIDSLLAQEERRVAALYDDRVAGVITPAQFREWNAESIDRQRRLRDEARAIEDRLLSLGRHADVDLVAGELGDVRAVLAALEPQELKRLANELLRGVRLVGTGEDQVVVVEMRAPLDARRSSSSSAA